ncbi:hypothetical protein L7F22_011942 [Adiantum nelumboides]|nr:hypothetical protein [Adiantum nelumboides]
MAKAASNPCRQARVSISILPCLILGTLTFGTFYARISFLSVRRPLAVCHTFPDPTCKNRKTLFESSKNHPSLTIFTAPHSFSNSSDDPQYQALLSWLQLQPIPKVVLLGNDPSFYSVSQQLCGEVSVEPSIDHNMWGTPLVHSMFARAQQADTDLSMVVNTDVFLFQDVMEAMHRVHGIHEKWVLVGKPRTVNQQELGLAFTPTGLSSLVDIISTVTGFPTTCKGVADLIMSRGYNQGPISYWAWNNFNRQKEPVSTLLQRSIPPFSYVKGTFEDWIHQNLIEGAQSHRVLIEASEAITSIRVASTFSLVSPSKEEGHINGILSHGGGDLDPYSVRPSWKMTHCASAKVHNLCLVEQKIKPFTISKTSGDNVESQDAIQQFRGNDTIKSSSHTLDSLLPLVADENKVVVMVGGTSNYKEMLLSFICRAQSLGIHNVLIAAFDEGLYEYAYLQGLPVYLESPSDEYKSVIGNDGSCVFASECFKRVTKLKSMSVLKVLKRGYSVLWSDMDIAWFENPLPQLLALGASYSLVIQSDKPNETHAENMGANSGFYLARSEEKTIRAFEAIVQHARKSQATEQPSFYIILCGQKAESRVGRRECVIRQSGLHTVFLDHEHYPNGHVFGHWHSSNATEACKKKGCVLLHNNFIKGKVKKLTRFVKQGLWFYDVNKRMCIQPWHPMTPTRVTSDAFQTEFLTALNITLPSQGSNRSL